VSCVDCYDNRRPLQVLAAVAEVGIGIFCLFLANAPRVGEGAILFVLIALATFALAGFCVWIAVRRFPPREESSTST
jgi:hypothetical protein